MTGCSTPFSARESASDAIDSWLILVRGWRGFGLMSATGMVRRPGSSPADGEADRMAARPRPIPRLGSGTGSNLLGKFKVRVGPGALRVVVDDGLSVARRLPYTDVARDDGVE